MKRRADGYLTEWKNRPGRKPLVLRGARQVGKTFLVNDWGARSFADVVRLDLERERSLHALFTIRDPRRLLDQIGLIRNRPVVPGTSLLFLDEIQACPAALPVLGDFKELLPDQHVIAAGSLLDFALREFAHSMPVGRIEYVHLQPLSFEEFLLAVGEESLVAFLQRYLIGGEINDAVSAAIGDHLRRYLFVGGMPEAVRAHAEGGSLVDVQRIQGSITDTLHDDFARYGTRAQQDLLARAFAYVAQHVGQKIKYSNISNERRAADVARALDLLAAARVIHRVAHTSANGVPLGAEANPRRFKTLFLDVGLVSRMSGLAVPRVDELLTVNEGALAEQFVGQELIAAGRFFDDPRLFYWHREAKNANAEVDYLVAAHMDVLPVEVKAARGGALKSMFRFLSDKRRGRAIRLYSGPAGVETLQVPGAPSEQIRLLSLPLFLAGQVPRLATDFCQPAQQKPLPD